MPNITRLVLRTGASAASLGAFAMNKAAEIMRAMAAEEPSRRPQREDPSPTPERTTRAEPVVAPAETPSNPAAPAGGDPDGTSGTGPVPRRISNPKAARKVRKRAESSSSVKRLEAKGAAKGAKPSTSKAEPTPSELAERGAGRQPAPMGSRDD